MQPAPEQANSKKSPSPLFIILVIIGVIGFLAIAMVGIGAVLAVYGTRRYIADAKRAEGRMGVATMARGMIACAAHEGAKGPAGLPPSSHKVPASMADVSGKKYQSTATDWTGDPAFACAHFEVSTPQYFQYEWDLVSPMKGIAKASADLDGDGTVEVTVESDVTCSAPGVCTVVDSPVK
jgi:type II secretory pathway pseudopilin PulG